MSCRFLLAGFQLSLIGRFWVSPEAETSWWFLSEKCKSWYSYLIAWSCAVRGFEWHPGIALLSCFRPRNTKGPIRGAHRDLYQKQLRLKAHTVTKVEETDGLSFIKSP